MINKDKLYHLIAGFIIFSVGYFAVNSVVGLALAFIAGTLKECYDEVNPFHSVDWLDLCATVAGSAIGLVIVQVLNAI